MRGNECPPDDGRFLKQNYNCTQYLHTNIALQLYQLDLLGTAAFACCSIGLQIACTL